ncbi:uncharacterized protein LOC116250965 [Nymphaea colorata]|uniref:uncharacterized protein LOC116250965 n=1 Tax=Nymphaea colorata TaxID=210225 RepID=UPI00129D6E4D|nr:uncharacterized protein LOC116250965 [Nymphaea colorata]
MEQRQLGGCCIDRYGPKVDRIMSRFRPIAPKPAVSGFLRPLPGGGLPSFGGDAARVSRVRRRCRRRGEAAAFAAHDLRLGPYVRQPPRTPAVVWPVRSVGSCVTVERVTEACAGAARVGTGTEREAMGVMESDPMPGFVSGPCGSVVWTNEAYRKMVGGGAGGGVVLLWKGGKEVLAEEEEERKVLACRVKVEWSGGKVTVPADVWRVAGGSLAWRLDVNAALSLGR